MLDRTADTVQAFKMRDSGIGKWFDTAFGYAVFPTVGKGAIGVGGAHGSGVVYKQGEPVGSAAMTQATIGLQLGGQAYTEIIFFQHRAAFDQFTTGNLAFSAQVSAVALTAGASADADYNKGVAVFTMTKGGLMYEASIGGQKFSYRPFAQ